MNRNELIYFEFTEFPGGPEGPFIDTVPASQSNVCCWEPNPHNGGWEINGEGHWRLGPYLDAEGIDAAVEWARSVADQIDVGPLLRVLRVVKS